MCGVVPIAHLSEISTKQLGVSIAILRALTGALDDDPTDVTLQKPSAVGVPPSPLLFITLR